MSPEAPDYIFQSKKDLFEHLAFKTIKQGFTSDEFLLVAVDVHDPTWSDLVDEIMEGVDWRAKRDSGELDIVYNVLPSEQMVDYLCDMCPGMTTALTRELPYGVVRMVVLAHGGESVHNIRPYPHYRNG